MNVGWTWLSDRWRQNKKNAGACSGTCMLMILIVSCVIDARLDDLTTIIPQPLPAMHNSQQQTQHKHFEQQTQ